MHDYLGLIALEATALAIGAAAAAWFRRPYLYFVVPAGIAAVVFLGIIVLVKLDQRNAAAEPDTSFAPVQSHVTASDPPTVAASAFE